MNPEQRLHTIPELEKPAPEPALIEGPMDAIAQEDIAGWTGTAKTVEEVTPFDSIEDKHIAGWTAVPNNDNDKKESLGKIYDEIKDAVPPQPKVAVGAPNIPPQFRADVKEDPAIAEMRGEGGSLDEIGRIANKVGTATAEWLPHSPFGRLMSRVERAGIRLMNAPQELTYSAMYRWRNEHVTAAQIDLAVQDKALTDAYTKLRDEDMGRAAFIEKQRAAGLPTTDVAIKLEGERAEALYAVEKAQKKHDRINKRLEDMNARKAGWAERENALAERTMAKIDKRLLEPRAKFEMLTAKKVEVDQKLESLKQSRTASMQELQALKAKHAGDPSVLEQGTIPFLIEAIEKEYADKTVEIDALTKSSIGVNTKMRRANNFISGWMGYRNEEARVTTQDRRTQYPYDQNIETEEPHEAPNLTHAPEPKAPERDQAASAPEPVPTVDAAPENPATTATAQESGPRVQTPEGREDMHKLLVTNIPLRKAFYALFRNHLYPKSRYVDGYVPTAEDIEKFIGAVPTGEAFDATFIGERAEQLKKNLLTETNALIKGNLEEALKLQTKDEKDTYPKVKAFLYGTKQS